MSEAHQNVEQLLAGSTPSRCVIVAELGVNHDGSTERALRLLESARDAGADAVKLQLFTPDELCSAVARAEEMRMLERLRLSDAAHARIVAAARELDLPVFATPFDEPSLELLRRLEIPLVKIGSGEVTHTPFLARVARTGLPVILSTGACELADVDRAVSVLRENGCTRLSLLHCVSAYPPPDDQLHLRLIPMLAARYRDCTIGFSDHSLGRVAATAAVALGARIIEKHLTLDRSAEGPDHAASADSAGFGEMVTAIRRVEAMLGEDRKTIRDCEANVGRCIVARRDLPAGHLITADDLAYKRAGANPRPYAAADLVGRRTKTGIGHDVEITATNVA